jgi:outer membrane immunogenic protein
MRKITLTLLATTAAFGLAATQATAADLPRKAPPPMVAPPPPLWNWTGLYVGGHLGAGWSRQEFGNQHCDGEGCIFDNGTGATVLGSHNGLGPLGGFQVGYNWQFANSPIVLGVEGTFSFADLKGEHSKAFSAAFASGSNGDTSTLRQINFNDTFSSKVKDIATITARLGLASGAQDRTLWYIKGGGAYAKTNYELTANASNAFITIDAPDLTPNFTQAENAVAALTGQRSRWGWTVGTGIEWGLWENWSAKIEYDYLNFGNHDVALNGQACFSGSFGSGCDPASATVNVKEQVHMIVIGLNYRFNWARY